MTCSLSSQRSVCLLEGIDKRLSDSLALREVIPLHVHLSPRSKKHVLELLCVAVPVPAILWH